MRTIGLGITLALLAAPAFAQYGTGSNPSSQPWQIRAYWSAQLNDESNANVITSSAIVYNAGTAEMYDCVAQLRTTPDKPDIRLDCSSLPSPIAGNVQLEIGPSAVVGADQVLGAPTSLLQPLGPIGSLEVASGVFAIAGGL